MKRAKKFMKQRQFVPDPKRALWLSLVLPGAGQIYNRIYNRKYWKLPFIYGGFLGCTYALLWNQQMYRDYSQAYLAIMYGHDRNQLDVTWLTIIVLVIIVNLVQLGGNKIIKRNRH